MVSENTEVCRSLGAKNSDRTANRSFQTKTLDEQDRPRSRYRVSTAGKRNSGTCIVHMLCRDYNQIFGTLEVDTTTRYSKTHLSRLPKANRLKTKSCVCIGGPVNRPIHSRPLLA